MFLKDVENALKYVNLAIEHTPTLIDLYTLKGKIMQIAGDRTKAAAIYEEARCLDTADRALNAISAIYQVKAGLVDQGSDTIGIFFKDCGYESTVHDNQCLWFEQVCGKKLYQLGKYQESLKEYTFSINHIKNMIDDQYDYYLYSLRKFTLTSFEGLMKVTNNQLHRYKHVVKTAIGVCKIGLRLSKTKDEELAKFTPLKEEYLKSEEYLAL